MTIRNAYLHNYNYVSLMETLTAPFAFSDSCITCSARYFITPAPCSVDLSSDQCVCLLTVVHDRHRVHLQSLEQERDQGVRQRPAGVEHGDGLVRLTWQRGED